MDPPSSGWCGRRWPMRGSVAPRWMWWRPTARAPRWAIASRAGRVWWSAGSVELLTEAHPWPAGGRVHRAGVSSFGISGTNAHVIIEAAPTVNEAAERGTAPPVVPWVISAKSAAAVSAQAARLGEFIDAREQLDAADVGWSLAGRSKFEHRAVVLGADCQELLSGLAELAGGMAGLSVGQGAA